MSSDQIDNSRGIQTLRLIKSFYTKSLDPLEISILTYLSLYWFKSPVASVSVRTLAQVTNRTAGRISQTMQKLEADGIIRISQAENNANVYSLIDNPIRYGRLAVLLKLTGEDYERIEEDYPGADREWVQHELRAFNAYYLASPKPFRYSNEPLAGFLLWLNRSVARMVGSPPNGVSADDPSAALRERLRRAAHLSDD